ncbi:MAG TPA: PRC-barrel domain-containing protein [Gillisia sp.]|nr:PRC-barrel domain-containing protein [Gillisia sp.]
MATKHENKNKNLFYLNELSDYKVSSDDPDVRGWEVKDKDNRVIGKVDNLLVNKQTQRVVYLDVEVDTTIIEANHDPYGQPADSEVHEFINKEGENHIIIPVGLVNLNEDQKFVYTDRVNHQTFAETKRIEKGAAVNREYEVVVLDSYDRTKSDSDRRDSNRDEMRHTSITGTTADDSDSSGNWEQRRENDPNFQEQERRDADRAEHGRRDKDETYRSDRNMGRTTDDDDFYERREFDGSNYRRRR